MRPLSATFVVIFAVLAGTAGPSRAQPPAGYYDFVDTSSGATLRSTAHAVIDDHTRHPYTSPSATDTWDILESADEDPADSGRILDVYRNASYAKVTGGNSNYNREHTWPTSYGFSSNLSSNYPFTDAHALFLSNSSYNSSRSNLPYRSCDSACLEKVTEVNGGQGGGSGTFPGNSNWRSGSGSTGRWQTWLGRQGDVARALLYLDVRYEGGTHGATGHAEPDLILTDDLGQLFTTTTNVSTAYMGELATLLAWHEADPVDDKERSRNNAVFESQGNRNLFIDNPEWVSCVFQGQCNTTCTYTLSPTSQGFSSGGGSGTVTVTTSAGCTWSALSNANWLTITSSATGSGSVSYSVASNGTGSQRTGTLTIASQTFTVTQSAACAYSSSPTSVTVAAAGQTGSVSVTAGTGCAWTAASNDGWISVTGGASGSGNGMVSYSAASNGSTSSRSGALTIAGQTFTVSQRAQFTDDPIVPGTTVVKAVHFQEMRDRIDLLRADRGLGAFGWTTSSLSGAVVGAVHMQELRDALAAVYAADGVASPTYTNGAAAGTTVRAVDITELRAAIVAIE
jgi:endonuclease I